MNHGSPPPPPFFFLRGGGGGSVVKSPTFVSWGVGVFKKRGGGFFMNHGSPPQPHFILRRGRHARCELTRQAWFRWLRNVDKTGEILVVQSEEFTIRAATAERLKRVR